jgi:hypothetical protein
MGEKYQSVLSIDWDWFFPGAENIEGNCSSCSWRQKCTNVPQKAYKRAVRPVTASEASCFSSPEQVLPLKGEPYKRLLDLGLDTSTIASTALYVAECHADILPLIGHQAEVVNLDAHDDFNGFCYDGCNRPPLTCGSWAIMGMLRGQIAHYQWLDNQRHGWQQRAKCWDYNHKLPTTVDNLLEYSGDRKPKVWPLRFDCIFVCWSRPWTPKQHDADLAQFCRWLAFVTGSPAQVIGREPELTKKMISSVSAAELSAA